MLISLTTLLATLSSIFRSRAAIELENLALHHEIGVLQRSARKRPKLTSGDRLLWVWLSRLWNDWRSALVSIDFFTVPSIRFQVLDVFLVLAHDRRRIVHCHVTAHPTAEWTGQQLREAFPFDQLPRYLLRDRDAIFGDAFRGQVRDLGVHEVLCTPRSPWQRAYVERVMGSIRREGLDPVLVFHETSLRRILRSYLDYDHRSRTHLSLGKDSPEPRAIQPEPMGKVVALPQVGGLHHRYERRAA